jgi:hypothetical protein
VAQIARLSDPRMFEKMLSLYQSFTTVTASLNGGLDLECQFKLFKVNAAKDQTYAALSFADQDGIVEQSKYDVQNCQFPNTCHFLVYNSVKVMILFNLQEAISALQPSEPLYGRSYRKRPEKEN